MLPGMKQPLPVLTTMSVCLLLAACSTMTHSVVVEPASGGGYHSDQNVPPPPARTAIPGGSYAVVKGDTMYSIAFRNKVDVRDLAQWNAVDAPYIIHPGQRLRLSPGKAAAGTVAAAPNPNPPAAATVVASRLASPPPPPVASTPTFQPVTEPASGSSSAKPTSAASGGAVAATAPASKSPAPAVATTTTVVPVAGVKTPPPAALPPPLPVQAVAAGPARAVSGVTWRWPAQGTLIKRFQVGDAIPGIEIGGNAGDSVQAAADGVVVYSGNGLVGYGELVIIKHSDSFLSAYGHNSKRLVKEGQRVTAGQQIAEMGSTGAPRNELQFQIRKDGNPVDPLGYLPAH